MNILLTNDDGINASGLFALYQSLKKHFQVTVCAPEAEQSAIGHAITLSRPLRINKISKGADFFGYAVGGTPADCVKIAIRCLLKKKPDMVISGINHGPNLGSDIMYSGTVSAATEGTILGIPSMAVSLATYKNQDFSYAAKVAAQLAKQISKFQLPDGVLLNVNVPSVGKSHCRGIKVTKQGRSLYREDFVRRIDPRGRVYYWLTGKVKWMKKPLNSDIKAVEDNYVSITPLQLDLTSYPVLAKLEGIKIDLK